MNTAFRTIWCRNVPRMGTEGAGGSCSRAGTPQPQLCCAARLPQWGHTLWALQDPPHKTRRTALA